MIRILAVALTVTLAAAALPQGTAPVEAAEKKVKAQKSTKKGKGGGRIDGQQLQSQLQESNQKKKKGLKSK